MPFYLSEYTGKGTSRDPMRPIGSDQPDWSAIDIRPDTSRLDGGGWGKCLLHVPEPFKHPKVLPLADDRLAVLSPRQRQWLTNRVRVDLDKPRLLRDVIATMLVNPHQKGWKPLRPTRLRWEIWLGGLLWSVPRISGGASDNFNRANGTVNAGNASWIKASTGNAATADIVSNVVQGSNSSDKYYYYSGAAVTASQYAQITVTQFNADLGPAVRMSSDSDPGGVDMYLISLNVVEYAKFNNGLFQSVGAFIPGSANDVIRLEVSGSTLSGYKNGIPVTPRTDTVVTTANNGVGFFHFEQLHSFDDWSGGDLGADTTTRRYQIRRSRMTSW